MAVGNLIARIFLGIILFIGLFVFMLFFSVTQTLDEQTVDEIISDVGADLIEEQITGNSDEINVSEFYNDILTRCEGQDNLVLEGSNVTIDCELVRNSSEEEVAELVRAELKEEIEEEISIHTEDLPTETVGSAFNFIILISGIFSLVILIVLFLISSPRYKFFITFGIVGIIFVLPAISANNLPLEALDNEVVLGLISETSRNIFINSIILSVVGVVSLLAGIFIGHDVQKGKKKK